MRFLITALFLGVFTSSTWAQNSPPTYKMDGQATLMSNLVEYGLTQTHKDPALQGLFWFNWGPQFRLGLEGNNVRYDGSDSHFLLRLNGDLKISFSDATDLTITYSDHHYFQPESRNGNILGLNLNLWGYVLKYQMLSNFFGTSSRANAVALSKTWPVFTNWKWENTFGYMLMGTSDLSNYFYYETYMGIKPGGIYYQIGANYNSQAGQFGGAGDLMILILKATVNF